jgi:hypothetical protein
VRRCKGDRKEKLRGFRILRDFSTFSPIDLLELGHCDVSRDQRFS